MATDRDCLLEGRAAQPARPGRRRRRSSTVVLAIGGNSLIRDSGHLAPSDQYEMAQDLCRFIADLVDEGLDLVITHGNGPQVGFLYRKGEIAQGELPPEPLDYCSANTQGAIGYMFQRALLNEFKSRGLDKQVAVVVTQTVVDLHDPAFENPTKPIGVFMSEIQAMAKSRESGWQVMEDARRGYRRVVSSPMPREILGVDVIRTLSSRGHLVIAAGGGGIPVTRDRHGDLQGVEAVIDKDLASALLARNLGADTLIISTAVDSVYLEFGGPDQRPISRTTVSEMKRYLAEGQFGTGSMRPKVEAVIGFLQGGGKRGIITSPANLVRAVRGEAGTIIDR
jgi:carbamate kinase